MTASLAIEQLQLSRLRKDEILGTLNDAGALPSPRRNRSNKSERNRQIRLQLNESAIAMQMAALAQASSEPINKQRNQIKKSNLKSKDKEKRSKSRSRSPPTRRRGRTRSSSPTGEEKGERCKSRSPTRREFLTGDPQTVPVVESPRRSNSQPATLRRMQVSLSPLPVEALERPSSSSMLRPPRSPVKIPRYGPVAMATAGTQSLFVRSESADESATQSRCREARKERRGRRDRKSATQQVQVGSTTQQKRSRSKTSRKHKSHHQLARSGVCNGSSIGANSSSVTDSATKDQAQLQLQVNLDEFPYSITKEQLERKDDSCAQPQGKVSESPRRESPHGETSQDALPSNTPTSQPLHLDRSSSLASSGLAGRWEPDMALPTEPGSTTIGSSVATVPSSSHPGIIVSTSTKRRSRPARTSSINSNAPGTPNSCSSGGTRTRYVKKSRSRRLVRSASESTMNSAGAAGEVEVVNSPADTLPAVTRAAATTNSSTGVPEPKQIVPTRRKEVYTPPFSPYHTKEPPETADVHPRPVSDTSKPPKQGQERLLRQRQSKPRRGGGFMSGIRKSFSFSGRGRNGSLSVVTVNGNESKRKTDNDSNLSRLLRNPALESPVNTERTGRTLSTSSTDNSEVSNLNRFNNSPIPRSTINGLSIKRFSPKDTIGMRGDSLEGDKSKAELFNMGRLRVEFDKPRGVDDDIANGKPASAKTIDPHILVAAASAVVDPDAMLAAHFEKAKRRAAARALAPKDVDECSDIISMTYSDGPTPDLHPSPSPLRSRSLSFRKKRNKVRRTKEIKAKTVCFSVVRIREYERSIGDNPAVGAGPPIGLGWSYLEANEVPIDEYETEFRSRAPRTRKDFFLPPQKRFHILLDEWGYSVQSICKAKDEASEIRYQRQVSVFGNVELQNQVKNKAAAAVAAAAAAGTRRKKTKSSKLTHSKSTTDSTPEAFSPTPIQDCCNSPSPRQYPVGLATTDDTGN